MRGRGAAMVVPIVVLAVGVLGASGDSPSPPATAPAVHPGLRETTGITLTILDVEVRDKDGRPMRGLRRDDFQIRLGSQEWPLYSLDDLCTCPDESSEQAAARGGGPVAASAGATGAVGTSQPVSPAPADAVPADPQRYVLFLDFGQLQVSGRSHALRESRRWIQDVKQQGDEVMIASYTEQRGLVELSPFTADVTHLLDALGRAETDPTLQDVYPSAIESRYQDCQEDTARCLASCSKGATGCQECYPTVYCQQLGYDEYQHARNSLLGLKDLLVSLESIPGRKALLHFQQNGTIYPGKIYNDTKLTPRTGDQVHLLDELGAEANLARTAIHGAYVGDRLGADTPWENELADQSVTVASNLADSTGGTYGRDLNALKGLTTAVRRDCDCIYRLGLEAPAKPSDRIYTVSVEIRGRPLPHAYRVTFLDEAGRWLRQAVAVLRNPESRSQIPIAAALVPAGRSAKGGWDVWVRIAFDLDALEMVPERDARRGSWEAGALLARDDGTQQWELMSVSSVRRAEPAKETTVGDHPASAVLHEQVISGIAPGRLTLRAFVRDRTARVLGGASMNLDLPPTSEDGLCGPVLLFPSRRHLLAPLPFFTKGGSTEARITAAGMGEIPSPSTVRAGDPIEAVTWICPRRAAVSKGREEEVSDPRSIGAAVTRELAGEGVDASTLSGTADVTREGDCYRFRDTIPTSNLGAGAYVYTLSWKPSKSGKPLTARTRVTIETPAKNVAGVAPGAVPALDTAPAAGDTDRGSGTAHGSAARSDDPSAHNTEQERLLALLARRAELHRSLLYRFQCTEDLTRKLQRRPKSAYGMNGPEDEVHDRCGIVVEKRRDGVARTVRTELDNQGSVKVNRKGEPVEALLKAQFNPVAKAVPHAQAATFTEAGQADLEFHLMGEPDKDGPSYRIRCPEGDVAIEFLDREPLKPAVVCKGQASGQMCVDRVGEISVLAFYGLIRDEGRCLWDRAAPFALVEQGLIETRTGARFPSRVRTIFSVSSRDNALFDQRYENCGFTNVETQETYGEPGSGGP